MSKDFSSEMFKGFNKGTRQKRKYLEKGHLKKTKL